MAYRDPVAHAKYQREWRARPGNAEKHRALVRERSRRERIRIKQMILYAKNRPCADCGDKFDPVCMDFDHLPQYEKLDDIHKLLRRRATYDTIKAEIAKCELVCACCHRLRTKSRMPLDNETDA